MDEVLKRIPRQRLEAQIKLHKLAHYTILRNWVGQSTTEDLYDLCDRYGIMVWDEFFQANPANGLNPLDATVVSLECSRQGAAVPKPSVDRDLVRAQRRRPAARDRSGQSPRSSRNSIGAATINPVRRRATAWFPAAADTAGASRGCSTETIRPSTPKSAAPRFPRWKRFNPGCPRKISSISIFPTTTGPSTVWSAATAIPVDKPFQTILAKRYGPYQHAGRLHSQIADGRL